MNNLRMTSAIHFLTLIVSVLLVSGCGTAQRGAMLRAYSGIENREYDFALKRLADAESYAEPDPELKAQIAYLKGICFEGLSKIPEAKGIYKYLIDTSPNSQYSYMARERLNAMQTNSLLELFAAGNRKQQHGKRKPKGESDSSSPDESGK